MESVKTIGHEITDTMAASLKANGYVQFGNRVIKINQTAYELWDDMVRITRYKSLQDIKANQNGHRFEYDTLSSMTLNRCVYIDCHNVVAYSDDDAVYIPNKFNRINEVIQAYKDLMYHVKGHKVGFDKVQHIKTFDQLIANDGDKINIIGEHVIIDFSEEMPGLKFTRYDDGQVMVFYDSFTADTYAQKNMKRGLVIQLTQHDDGHI